MSGRRSVGWLALGAMAFGLAGAGCGGGGASLEAGGAGAGGADGGDATDGAAGVVGDVSAEEKVDAPADVGEAMPEVAVRCPTAAGALAPAAAELVIDDFVGSGPLAGRQRSGAAFIVREQFDATAGAMFDPAPAIEPACGAAAPGAAHIRGRAANTGATFALVFGARDDGGAPADRFDASATTGLSFRVALGDAAATKLLSVQVNLAQSPWDYTNDVTVSGTAWQTVTIPWADLQAPPGAPAFSPSALNQIVFPFFADTDVDFYVDDIAFVR